MFTQDVVDGFRDHFSLQAFFLLCVYIYIYIPLISQLSSSLTFSLAILY